MMRVRLCTRYECRRCPARRSGGDECSRDVRRWVMGVLGTKRPASECCRRRWRSQLRRVVKKGQAKCLVLWWIDELQLALKAGAAPRKGRQSRDSSPRRFRLPSVESGVTRHGEAASIAVGDSKLRRRPEESKSRRVEECNATTERRRQCRRRKVSKLCSVLADDGADESSARLELLVLLLQYLLLVRVVLDAGGSGGSAGIWRVDRDGLGVLR